MIRRPVLLLALTSLALMCSPESAASQTDTTRRTQAESRGDVEPTRRTAGFNIDLPNYGLTTEQTIELQQALARVGCDVGTPDGVMGQRTLRALQCFRAQQPLTVAEVESMLVALNVSFAKSPTPVEHAAPPQHETAPALPPVIRPDTTYRADVRARRDSAFRRDSTILRDPLSRDSTRRDSTARPDTSVRRPPPLP